MQSLTDLQNNFAEALLQHPLQLFNAIEDKNNDVQQRMQIYRNNYFCSLKAALRNTYPTIAKLVGEDFFSAMAKQYIIGYPSTQRHLNEYGDQLGNFLKVFPPAQTLPYLPDVAKLEWYYHQAFYGAHHSMLDIKRLQSIPESRYEKIIFQLHPTARLLPTPYPLLRIWQLCREDDEAQQVDLAEGGDDLLIVRRDLTVTFERLSRGEFILLSGFANNAIFEEVCAAVFDVDAEFDLNNCLLKHISLGTLVDFK